MTVSGDSNLTNGANSAANGVSAATGAKPSWEELSAKKRSELQASIPKEWRIPENLMPPETQDDVTGWPEASGWFTEEELAITSLAAEELLSKLATGALKSEDVTRAFCKRAAAAHQLTNCLSETFFDRAIAMARARDEYFAETGKPMGPLHGLPISLKDNINVQSVDSTVGMAVHVGDPAKADATLAEMLAEAGAVFYVKTNVPTAMMIAETVNNVFGRTLNPRNRQTTSGGSSGGESALIVMKGSPVGVGSDIGGSLRIPAACTGIFTLRPSFGRFPVRNCRSGMPGQEAVASVNGPLAPTLDGIKLYSKAVISAQPWLRDPKCLPIPWRDEELPSKLRIGVMWHDGMVQPTAPVARALKHTVSRLKAAGHEIVEWDNADQAEGYLLMQRLFLADGGITIKSQLEPTGEPMRIEMQPYSTARELSTAEMWKLHLERTDFQNRHLDRWNKAGLDALLLPTIPFNTVKSGTFKHVGYTGVYNVLDYSAVSFPTGLDVDGSIDVPREDYSPLSTECKAVHETYDADLMHGLPISLQLVARRLEEEKVLAMTGRVLEALAAIKITKEDIQYKSKQDWLGKLFAALQILQLILSIITRHIQGVQFSQLETVTLSFAICGVLIYCPYFHKPQKVERAMEFEIDTPVSDDESQDTASSLDLEALFFSLT